MTLTPEEAVKLSKKLEYNFKKTKQELLERLTSGSEVTLSDEEKTLCYSKLEYRFKKSGDDLVTKLAS